MAIFHLSAVIHSRGKGHSAVAGAAYRARCAIADERTGERHDYSRRAADVLFESVYAPRDAPEWARDRVQLWRHVEAFEKRRDAQLCRSFDIALPHELTLEQNRRLLQDWVRDNFTRKGLIADVAIHAPHRTHDRRALASADQRNIHAHVAVVLRKLDGTEFAARKERTTSNDERKAELEGWRESWEKLANRHLERAGLDVRIDRRTLKEQGREAEATQHLGPEATALERQGIATELGDANREIAQRNVERQAAAALEREARQVAAEIIDLAAERLKRERPEGRAGKQEETRAGGEEWSAGPPIAGAAATERAVSKAAEGIETTADAGARTGERFLRGVGRLAMKFFEALADMIAPPPPPTPEQVRQAERAAAEDDRRAALRQHVAELAERQSSIVEQSRQRQRERDLADQEARWARRRDDGRERER